MKTAKPATSVKSVKPVASETPATTINPESAIRILKTATCPSLSGQSKLTFVIGLSPKSEIYFRVSANTGHGFFSDEWVPLGDIQQAFDKVPSGKPITSFALSPLYKGKSSNSPGFLFAVLKQEGLVQPSKDKARCYERGDLKGFMAGIKALNDLTTEHTSKPVMPRQPTAPAKKTAGSPKKAPTKLGAKKKS